MFSMPMADRVFAALASAGGTFAHIAAPAVVSALWQGAAIALILGLGLRLASQAHIHIGAAHRFTVWASAFAIVAGLPFLPSLEDGARSETAAHALFGASPPVTHLRLSRFQLAPFQLNDRWALALASLWLTASLVRAAILVMHSLRLRRTWRAASPVVADGDLREFLAAASPARRSVELCTTRHLDGPAVIGFFAPRILIPDWLYASLTPGELEQVILHETEHLRRGDDWTNLLQKLALVLFPLNPALAWIERRLCREREMACDEGVVRRTQEPHAYASCLASLAEHSLDRRRLHALSLGAFERRSELVRRVLSILARRKPLHPAAARAWVGVAACGLLAASVELARCPQMVAFIPGAQTTALEMETAQTNLPPADVEGDRVIAQTTTANSVPGFRAVEARAILPDRRVSAQSASASLHRPAGPANESDPQIASLKMGSGNSRAAAPREAMLKAEMTDSGSANEVAQTASDGEAQVVVFTAWEEVETAPRHSRQFADYAEAESAQPQSATSQIQTANRTPERTAAQITVTRLILLVGPRIAGSSIHHSAPGTKAARPAGFAASPLPAPMPESGWLVFQL
jgi:beta-lactamase regulating signal transducer with metallopeptidase domain